MLNVKVTNYSNQVEVIAAVSATKALKNRVQLIKSLMSQGLSFEQAVKQFKMNNRK